MDRGQWRRERAERPTSPPEPASRPAPAAQVAQPPEPAPLRRAWQGAPDRRGPARWERDGDRGDRRGTSLPRQAAQNGDWRSERDDDRDDRRGVDLPRPPVSNGDWRSGRAADPREEWQRQRAPQDRRDAARRAPERNWTAEPGRRRYDRGGGPTPPAAIWRSERDGRWDRAWRREPRYDWSRYRDERRSAFRLPRYYAPYGWNGGYRRFGIGMPLAPMLYTPRYWIYDPYAYRLPDADEPYRWVRYYDDALLVDIEDGTVVDVIHGIFE